jgi:hypothetical protein
MLELAIYGHQRKLRHWNVIKKCFLSSEEKQELLDFKTRMAQHDNESVEPLTVEQLTPHMIQEEVEIQDVVCENHLQLLDSYSENPSLSAIIDRYDRHERYER